MKVVLLAGGYGTRLSEETENKLKPLIEIGGMPIIWHIMKNYAGFGHIDFVVCLGYKGNKIKEFFHQYFLHHSNVTFHLGNGSMDVHETFAESWNITLVDTGLDTYTGGRIKRIQSYIGNETFMLTYCDGLADVNIQQLVAFHKQHGKKATMTSVQKPSRFGLLQSDPSGLVQTFQEKPVEESAWINGGYFVLEPSVFETIQGDKTIWERDPLEKLVHEHQLMVFPHKGYWQCMDTLRDKQLLEQEWETGHAAWKNW
ncbi:MAG: glucose-1-phosphate cytidylyltransferase [Caldisericia bacterium]|nr:glucose-1-phosphate cytidylyltransferase [Caldisericia bacterium]